MRRTKRQTLEEAFAQLEQAAAKGDRCPVSSGPGASLDKKHVAALAKAGRIAVEISSKNWRRVTILTGEHAGKSTAPSPHKGNRVYQTIDTRGTIVNGRLVDHGAASRVQPSVPRLLTREEIFK
jgi:hypothetical protein